MEPARPGALVLCTLLLAAPALAGCLGATDGPSAPGGDGDGNGDGPPVKDRWTATGCTGVSLVWTPPLAALDDVAGPHFTPAEGPVPGRGVFVLFTVECPDTEVNGNATGPQSGGAAIVRVRTPTGNATHNVTVADGWSAVPETVWSDSGPVFGLWARHGFAPVAGETSVEVTTSVTGAALVAMTYATPTGRVEATAALGGAPEERSIEGALATTDPATFGVFFGPESMTRTTGPLATVTVDRGETWLDRLDLPPTPFMAALDEGFAWDFTFFHEAWDA